MAKNNLIKTETAEVWMDDDGILWIDNFVPAITKGQVEENILAAEVTAGHIQRPVINLIDSINIADKEARDFGAGDVPQRVFSAMALITRKSSLANVIAKFYINISKPAFPTKVFDNETDGLAWLQQYLPEK